MTLGETEPAKPLEARAKPPRIDLVSVIVPHLDDYDNLDACLTLLGGELPPVSLDSYLSERRPG
jgi:hypothetical protein